MAIVDPLVAYKAGNIMRKKLPLWKRLKLVKDLIDKIR